MNEIVVDVARQTEIARERQAVVDAARSWIGTPFHHAARIKGVGVDCSQLLIAVFCEELNLVPPIDPGYYPPDWFLHREHEKIKFHLLQHCRRMSGPMPGDVGVFRYGRAASHAGIVVAGPEHPRVVHSFRGFGVTESEVEPGHHLFSRLDGWWSLKRWLEDPTA